MARKSKTRGANLAVPQTRDEAAAAVRQIGELNRVVARLEADMNDRLAAEKAATEERADPLRQRVVELTEGLKLWAEANRAALTDGGKTKTADLGTGKVSWRLRPASVRITKLDEVLQRLKTLGLGRFIRTKEEPNKEAMLAEPDVARTVAGVSIGSEGEDFIVEPFEAALTPLPTASPSASPARGEASARRG